MTSVDDLIQSLNGDVHVSQEGYDLQALQKYLSDHITLPPLANSPSCQSYRPLAPSRSVSSSRYASSMTHEQPFNGMTISQTEVSHYPSTLSGRSISRPGLARRSSSRVSSYSFYSAHMPNGTPAIPGQNSSLMEYSAFEGDAFAPLLTDQYGNRHAQADAAGPSDPWARIRQANQLVSYQQQQGQYGDMMVQNGLQVQDFPRQPTATWPQGHFQSGFPDDPTATQSRVYPRFTGQKMHGVGAAGGSVPGNTGTGEIIDEEELVERQLSGWAQPASGEQFGQPQNYSEENMWSRGRR